LISEEEFPIPELISEEEFPIPELISEDGFPTPELISEDTFSEPAFMIAMLAAMDIGFTEEYLSALDPADL
jgi:hypothetical protein